LRSLPCRGVPGHVTDGRGHGRIGKRIVEVVTVAAGVAFPHAAEAIQVTRKAWQPQVADRDQPRDRQPVGQAGRARSARRLAPRCGTPDAACPGVPAARRLE